MASKSCGSRYCGLSAPDPQPVLKTPGERTPTAPVSSHFLCLSSVIFVIRVFSSYLQCCKLPLCRIFSSADTDILMNTLLESVTPQFHSCGLQSTGPYLSFCIRGHAQLLGLAGQGLHTDPWKKNPWHWAQMLPLGAKHRV